MVFDEQKDVFFSFYKLWLVKVFKKVMNKIAAKTILTSAKNELKIIYT